jgi:Asp-tRNA(Asn)/Glu-tRNA(Gln) amidotransferase C subunit
MATPEEREKKAGEVKKELDELAKIDAKSLARTEDLSRDVNFAAAVPLFENMLNIIRQLQTRDISRLSTTHLNSIQTSCNRITDLIKKVREFTLNQNTPVDVCNNIVIEISNAYDIVMEPLTIPLAFTATQATDYARLEREAKGYHTNMKEEFDKFREDMKQFRTEAANALAAVKAQAAEAGVSTTAHIFVTNASEHGTLA